MKLEWKCYQVKGAEVFKNLTARTPLLLKEDVQPGDEVYCLTLFGEYAKAIVMDGCAYAETENNMYNLIFNEDDRHCWVSDFSINKKAMSRLNFTNDK